MAKIDKIKFVFSKSATPHVPAKPKKGKKNAVVICRDESRFWTTQKQFWQWVREKKIVKTTDFPLTGQFTSESEEKMIILANTVLNLKCPNHVSEAMTQRRMRKNPK